MSKLEGPVPNSACDRIEEGRYCYKYVFNGNVYDIVLSWHEDHWCSHSINNEIVPRFKSKLLVPMFIGLISFYIGANPDVSPFTTDEENMLTPLISVLLTCAPYLDLSVISALVFTELMSIEKNPGPTGPKRVMQTKRKNEVREVVEVENPKKRPRATYIRERPSRRRKIDQDLISLMALILKRLTTIEKNPGPVEVLNFEFDDQHRTRYYESYWIGEEYFPRPLPMLFLISVFFSYNADFYQRQYRLMTIEPNPGPESPNYKKRNPNMSSNARVAKKAITSTPVMQELKTINKNAAYLAKCITSPGAVNGIRLPTVYSDSFTSVAAPFLRTPTLFGTCPANFNQVISQNDAIAFVFRDPLRTIIYWDPNVAAANFVYNVYGVGYITGNGYRYGTQPSTTFQLPPCPAGVNTNIVTPYATCSSSYAPHGPCLYAGGAAGTNNRYLYCEQGNSVSFITTTNTNASLQLNVNVWTPDGPQALAGSVSMTNNTANNSTLYVYPINNSGYYSFSINPNVACIVTVNSMYISNVAGSATGVQPGGMMCHLSLPGLFQKMGSVRALRILGASMMYSNDASLNSRQGKVASYQASPGRMWTDFLKGYSYVAAEAKSEFLVADKGQYRWLSLQQDSDVSYMSNWTTTSGVIYDSYYNLIPTASFLVMYITITNPAGQDGQWEFCFNTEFTSDDTWFDQEQPNCTLTQWNAALEALKLVPRVTENPMHIKDIFSAIGRGLNTGLEIAKDYGPLIAKLASVLI